MQEKSSKDTLPQQQSGIKGNSTISIPATLTSVTSSEQNQAVQGDPNQSNKKDHIWHTLECPNLPHNATHTGSLGIRGGERALRSDYVAVAMENSRPASRILDTNCVHKKTREKKRGHHG